MEETQKLRALIAGIEEFCKGKKYLFRGTACRFDEVNSKLYRTYKNEKPPIFNENFQPVDIEKDIVEQARSQFTPATANVEILTDLRHFGAETTLIDFSHSLFVALFFACNGAPSEDGDLIALATDGIRPINDIDYGGGEREIAILEPARTAQSRSRVEFQCSVFVHAPKGCIPKGFYKSFPIPKDLKEACKRYLNEFCNIREDTIYNDLIGFIANQNNFETAALAFYRGLAAGESENFQDAIEYYNQAIELKPDFAEAYNNRGNAQAALGRHEEAIADYDQAIKLNPDYAVAYNNRGSAQAALGRHEEAIADYDQAIKLKPDYAVAYIGRGGAQAALGKVDEMRADFIKARTLAREQGRQDLVDLAEQALAILNKRD